jgi:hypothetical protein
LDDNAEDGRYKESEPEGSEGEGEEEGEETDESSSTDADDIRSESASVSGSGNEDIADAGLVSEAYGQDSLYSESGSDGEDY